MHVEDLDIINHLCVNNHGRTVLDNLMITILKGHTSCQPFIVNDNGPR